MLVAMGNLIKAVASLMIVSMIAAVGYVGFRKWEEYEKAREALRENERLKQEVDTLTLENQRLALANRLLKVDYQLAKIRMRDQYEDPQTGELVSVVEFWEVNEDGDPLDPGRKPETVRIKGKKVHVEGLVAKFDDKLVEEGDPLRGTAMFAFKAIFGENETPADGHRLYSKRTQPTAYYRGSMPTPFEEQMWNKFWDIANDPKQMAELNLRAIHGQGASMELREGNVYIVKLRSTGDVSIIPQDHRKVRPWERE
jgi:hypothetical protein